MPFFMVDPFLVVTHINERMEKLTGYSRREVVGRMNCGALLNTESAAPATASSSRSWKQSLRPDCAGWSGPGTAGRSR